MSQSGRSLTQLERELNKSMRCPIGKNQVYIRASIFRGGAEDKPEIGLRCRLRARNGEQPLVTQKFIEEVCCADPATKCPVYRTYLKTRDPSSL